MPEGALNALRKLAELSSEVGAARREQALSSTAPEGAGVLERRRIDVAKKPFQLSSRVRARPAEIVSDSTQDMPRGAALDLSALGSWDLGHYQPLERARPTKISDRAKKALTPENTREFESYVRQGIRGGGLNWYDVSPLSRVALQEMSPEDFRVLMAMNAASSARSSVQDQIKRASLAWYFRKQGIPWPMSSKDLAEAADPGYGHLAHDIHSKHLAPLVAGEEPNFSSIDQPKYASYYNNFMGNLAPITADTHYQALHGFPFKQTYNKYIKDWVEMPDFSKSVDYPIAEAYSSDRARRMGITPAMYQSSAWVGGQHATGVKDARPFAAVYDDLIARTAQQMDISPLEALKKHLRGELPLAPIGGKEFAEGGYAGGGMTKQALNALAQYVRYRLPREHAMEEIRPMGGIYNIGTGRQLFSVGRDKIAKLARSPQGLYEQGLEGEHRIVQPHLYYRTPDDELTLLERMPDTFLQSRDWLEPMANHYQIESLRRQMLEPGDPQRDLSDFAGWHRRDPVMSQYMQESGLGPFMNDNVLPGDFFNRPEHWAMRSPSVGRNPVLLDAGARSYHVTDRPWLSQNYAPKFRDVALNRLQSMRSGITGSEVEERLNELKQDPQFGLGFRRGGKVEALLGELRQKFAGGGVVRNWLRGVKGSGFDRVIDEMKNRATSRFMQGRDLGDMPEPGVDDAGQAVHKWIDKNFANYMARQMGAEGDPLEPLTGGQTRMVVKQLRPGDAAKHLVGDGYQPPRQTYRGRRPDEEAALAAHRQRISEFESSMPPWLKKAYDADKLASQHKPHLKPDQYFHDIDYGGWQTFMRDPMHGVLDYLRHRMTPNEQGIVDLKPEQLARMSVPEAFKGSKDWHEMLARKAEEERDRAMQLGPWLKTHKEYPTGFKWMQYDPNYVTKGGDVKGENGPLHKNGEFKSTPEYEQMEAALSGEGESMGHCVGDYCPDVVSGNTQIFSLRDPKGRPHVTVEVQPNTPGISGDILKDRYGARGADLWDRWMRHYQGREPGNYENLWDVVKQHAPDIHEELMSAPPSIVQIKGKANAKPKDEYLPYVQDFVRSGKWGDVGDLQNTGLVNKWDRVSTSLPSEAPGEIWRNAKERFGSQQYWTQDEINNMIREEADKAGYKFAAGGAVRPPDFPVETPDEALMRAQLSLKILLEERQHASAPERPALEREIQRTEQLIARLSGADNGSSVKSVPGASDLQQDDPTDMLDVLEQMLGGGNEQS